MPKYRAEAVDSQRLDSRDESVVGFSVTDPGTIGLLFDPAFDCGWILKAGSFGEPLADASCADPAGDETNWDLFLGNERIA